MKIHFLIQFLVAYPSLVAAVTGIRDGDQSHAAIRKRREVIHVDATQKLEGKILDFNQLLSTKEKTESLTRFLQGALSLALNPSSSPTLATQNTPSPSQMFPDTPEPNTPSQVKATPFPTFPGKTAAPNRGTASPETYRSMYPTSAPDTPSPTYSSKTSYPTPPKTPAPVTLAPSRFGKTNSPSATTNPSDQPALVTTTAVPTIPSSSVPSITPSTQYIPGDTCFVQVEVDCTPPDSADDCDSIPIPRDECLEKVFSMGFRYNGGDCTQSSNVQDPTIFQCEDYFGGPPTEPDEISYVLVQDIKGLGVTYFEGFVPVRGQLTLANGGDFLGANVNVTIYDTDIIIPSNIRQTMVVHTSCSQVTFLKDRYGSVELISFDNTMQGFVSCFVDLSLAFAVGNVVDGFNVILETLTSVTNFDEPNDSLDFTDQVKGVQLTPAQTLPPLIATVTIDLSVRTAYTVFTTVQGASPDEFSCRATDFISFTAGNTEGSPTTGTASPSPSSIMRVPTISPTSSIALTCAEIPENGCSICGEKRCITKPDAIFSFPGQPMIRCDLLQTAGFNGQIQADQCPFLPDLVIDDCGCAAEVLPVSPAPEPTPAPIVGGDCPSVPDGGCSVCGSDRCISKPDEIFSFTDQPMVRCDDLQQGGINGQIPVEQCLLLPDLIVTICGCVPYGDSTPAPSLTPAPILTQAPTLALIVTRAPTPAPTQAPTQTPTPAPTQTPTETPATPAPLPVATRVPDPTPAPIAEASCPTIQPGGCSICGDSACITQPEEVFTFPGQPSVPCGTLQFAGETGLIPLDQCPFLVGLVTVCGCAPASAQRNNKDQVSQTKTVSPTLSLKIPDSTQHMEGLIKSTSTEDGSQTKYTVQAKALVWLSSNKDLAFFDESKMNQRYALACIYFSTYAVPNTYTNLHLGRHPKGWLKADSWMTDDNECDWYGIECDSDGNVEAIELKANGLSGVFPSEVVFLSDSLIRLDLNNNWVHNRGDELNSFLGQLSNLEYLFIGSTFFEYDKGVPSAIGLLSKLIAFDASNTEYTGKLIGDAFANKTLLQSVNLSGNNFERSEIPTQLIMAPKLKHLYLEAANLTGDLSFLGEMKELAGLWIGNNKGIIGSIPASISQATTLETLSITHCSVTGSLPSELGALQSLKEIWLYDNKLTGKVPEEIGDLASLHTLELEHNDITGEIPQGVCNLIHGTLTVLETDCVDKVLCDCCTACFGNPLATSTKSIAVSMIPSPSGFSTTQPSSQAPSSPPSLSPVATLIYSVSIHKGMEFVGVNSYQSRALAWVESHENLGSYSDAKVIQRYVLACVYYSTYSVKTPYTHEIDIPGWTNSAGWMDTQVNECQWHGLDCDSNGAIESIELPSNSLTGHFAPEVQLLKDSLIRLDIFDNHVYNPGHMFNAFLGELTNMQYLYYGFTNFEYEKGIPTQLNKLTRLIEYDCAYTLYHGEIQGEAFANLSKLKRLTMGGNAYNSSVPTEISELESLEYLYIENADLTGNLSFIGDLIKIKELWIDTNPALTGSIPSSVGNLSTLQSLSITNSGLTGTIPTQLGDLSRMQQLWLYGNELAGQVPTEIGNLNRMRIMELEKNHLTGTMPTEVCFNRPPFGSLAVLEVDCANITCSCSSSCA